MGVSCDEYHSRQLSNFARVQVDLLTYLSKYGIRELMSQSLYLISVS